MLLSDKPGMPHCTPTAPKSNCCAMPEFTEKAEEMRRTVRRAHQ
jgi:hypothetical protein